jgi:N4-gp56 family major capsid protein
LGGGCAVAWTEESGLRAQAWAKELLRRAINKSTWFTRYAGEGLNNIVQVKTDLSKKAGDRINFGLLPRISPRTSVYAWNASTITGDTDLEGEEQDLSFLADSVVINQYRAAVKSPGAYYEQKVSFDARSDMAEALSIWLKEELDWNITRNLMVTPTTSTMYYPGVLTSSSGLASTDTVTVGDIMRLKVAAKYRRIRPIIVGGQEFYLFLMHPEVMYDLKTAYPSDAPSWYRNMLEAKEQGGDNPVFTGAAGVVDGVILAENRDLYKYSNQSAIAFSRNLFLGAQAGLWAWAKKPFWVEKLFDYKNRLGVASGYIGGCKKAVFDSTDFAVLSYICANTEISSGAVWD